jgi:hypothetical protein
VKFTLDKLLSTTSGSLEAHRIDMEVIEIRVLVLGGWITPLFGGARALLLTFRTVHCSRDSVDLPFGLGLC